MPSHDLFRSVDAISDSLGIIVVALFTPQGVHSALVNIDTADADIPAFFGMHLLDKKSCTPCTASNRFPKRVRYVTDNNKTLYLDEWAIFLICGRKYHLNAELQFPSTVHFTRSQLAELHRHLFDTSTGKMFNLLKRSKPEDIRRETFKIPQEISQWCNLCQKIQNTLIRYKVTLGAEQVQLNEAIFLDTMIIDRDLVLHIVDDGTKFGAAHFLPDSSTRKT